MASSQAESKAEVAVWQYCPPVLFAFGTFGNVMTIVILRRMNLKKSAMPIYLTALALSDMSLLYMGLMRRWIMNVFDLDIRTLHVVVCKIHTWWVYASVIVSAWLLTTMTMERALSVWLPYRVSLLCTRRKAGVIIAGIVISSLLINAHFLYGVEILVHANGTRRECGAPEGDYLYFFDAVWSWVDLTLSSLVPFTLLIIGNGLILWKVSRSVRDVRTLSVASTEVRQRKRKVSSMTVTLVALSAIFLLTTSPICVYNVVEHFVEKGLRDDPRGQARMMLAWAVVNILMYTNSTVNFYLYCLSGVNFRRELRRCLCCSVKPTPFSDPGSKPHPRNTGHYCNHNSHTPNHHHHHHHSHTPCDHPHCLNHHSHSASHQHSRSPDNETNSRSPLHIYTLESELSLKHTPCCSGHAHHRPRPNGTTSEEAARRTRLGVFLNVLRQEEDRHSLSTEF